MCRNCLEALEKADELRKMLTSSELEHFSVLRSCEEVLIETVVKVEEAEDEIISYEPQIKWKESQEEEIKMLNQKSTKNWKQKRDAEADEKVVQGNKCQICNRKFKAKRDLIRHMGVHSDAKPFQCDVAGCGKGYKFTQDLKSHKEAKHSSISAIKCAICSNTFRYKSNLQRHIKEIHLKKLSFECDCCSKVFHAKLKFIRHFRAVHNKSKQQITRPTVLSELHCKVCFKKMTKKDILRRHMEMVHEKKKNFACSVCQKKFYSRGSYTRHLTIHIAICKKN